MIFRDFFVLRRIFCLNDSLQIINSQPTKVRYYRGCQSRTQLATSMLVTDFGDFLCW